MDKKLYNYSIIGFVFVGIIGSISHFVFGWSNYTTAIGCFFPVNESTWEHLKLIFFPYLIWAIAEYYLLKKEKGVLISKCIGVISGMLAVVIFFYTYTGVSGKSIGLLNILSFFIGVGTAFLVDYFLIKSKKLSSANETIALAVFIIIGALFFIFTFAPPLIPLFKDPINSTYGI
ncbi:MAG: hypothetical protein J1E36_08865 [Eubacterium sp.]|nr:hypothetical protein [Eubacterium sp.]